MGSDDYLKYNRDAWNSKVESHLASDFYRLKDFKSGWNSISEIEAPLLKGIEGSRLLHLQCHFGQDTLSLQRMGADCTGVDLSDKAIKAARELAQEMKLKSQFIASDVYSIGAHNMGLFDYVFSSYGTIGWLPELDPWATLIAQHLKPGGSFVFAEFHPVIWMHDVDFKFIEYSYFNRQTIEEIESGTYADREAQLQNRTISWNHDLGEVLTALLKAGLQLEYFQEYDFSPYNCFKNMVESGERRYQVEGLEGKIPMVYALKMRKA